jgi:hypothetical protein
VHSVARVVELVDARDSKSRAARRAGSIPAPGTRRCFCTVKQIKTRSSLLKSGFFIACC